MEILPYRKDKDRVATGVKVNNMKIIQIPFGPITIYHNDSKPIMGFDPFREHECVLIIKNVRFFER